MTEFKKLEEKLFRRDHTIRELKRRYDQMSSAYADLKQKYKLLKSRFDEIDELKENLALKSEK